MESRRSQSDVSFNLRNILELVKQLSPVEKQQLSEVLWTEQQIQDIVIPEEQKEVVRQRIDKYKNVPESYLTWDQIEQKLATRR